MKKLWVIGAVVLCMACAGASAQTAYYYNPDGGRHYHAQRECGTISEKYWDSLREISVEETGARGLTACPNCVQQRTGGAEIIGGSGFDQLNELALTADGRIVAAGSTHSSDGTLSDRSKTGRTGWIACLDSSGNTLWNFCSRNSTNDLMMCPAAHADGTITALLRSDGHDYNQIELIRLSADGKELARRTLMKLSQEEAHCALEWPKTFAGGYVVSRIDHDDDTRKPTYCWYDFEGNELKTSQGPWADSIMAMGQNHVIEVHDEAYWLCRMDEKGKDTRLSQFDGGRYPGVEYGSLISLDDGGAAACGGRWSENGYMGVLSRWDADGNLTAEIQADNYRFDDIALVQDGYIVSGWEADAVYTLLHISETGEVQRLAAPEGDVYEWGTQMCVLPNGNIAVIAGTQNGANKDAVLRVVEQK